MVWGWFKGITFLVPLIFNLLFYRWSDRRYRSMAWRLGISAKAQAQMYFVSCQAKSAPSHWLNLRLLLPCPTAPLSPWWPGCRFHPLPPSPDLETQGFYQHACSKSWRSIPTWTQRAIAHWVTRCIIRTHSADRLMGVQWRSDSSKLSSKTQQTLEQRQH